MQILSTPRRPSPSSRVYTVGESRFQLLLPLQIEAVSPGIHETIAQAFIDAGYPVDVPEAPPVPAEATDEAVAAHVAAVAGFRAEVARWSERAQLITALYALLLLDDRVVVFEMPFDRLAFLRSPSGIVELAQAAKAELYSPEALMTIDLSGLFEAIDQATKGAPGN